LGNQDKQLITKEQKVNHISNHFKVAETITHLHHLMKEVTKKEINASTVNAACQCVCRLNETIDTTIKAAKFISEN
jgi:hypothetical protein